MDLFPGLPPDGSAHGSDIDLLIGLVHWFILALFVGWGLYLLSLLVRFRASKQPKARFGGPKARWFFVSVAAVFIIEVILDFGFSVPIWSRLVGEAPSEKNATVVRIVAEQYAWNIHYPGPDGIFGSTSAGLVGVDNPLGLDRSDPPARDDITTVNQLNVPVDKPVLIYLSSKDVIHSLSLPAFRVKQDAVPGLTVPVWFHPTKTTDRIREEMVTGFDIGRAVATSSSISLPPSEEFVLGGSDDTDGYALDEDYSDREGIPLAYAGEELTEESVIMLREAGISSVRAHRTTVLDSHISLEQYYDSEGNVILEQHEVLSEDVVSRLVIAGVTMIRARESSAVDPWMVMEDVLGPGGELIVSSGSYLDEQVITDCAGLGKMDLAVAPLTPTEIACAQLCGLGHYRMRGYLEVQTSGDFASWMEGHQEVLRETFGAGAGTSGDTGSASDPAEDSTISIRE